MDLDEIKEQIAWAERVTAAPDSTTLDQLLARALADTSRELIRIRGGLIAATMFHGLPKSAVSR